MAVPVAQSVFEDWCVPEPPAERYRNARKITKKSQRTLQQRAKDAKTCKNFFAAATTASQASALSKNMKKPSSGKGAISDVSLILTGKSSQKIPEQVPCELASAAKTECVEAFMPIPKDKLPHVVSVPLPATISLGSLQPREILSGRCAESLNVEYIKCALPKLWYDVFICRNHDEFDILCYWKLIVGDRVWDTAARFADSYFRSKYVSFVDVHNAHKVADYRCKLLAEGWFWAWSRGGVAMLAAEQEEAMCPGYFRNLYSHF